MRDFSISEEIKTRCENASDLLNRLNSLLVDADGKISDAVELINKDGGLGYIDYTSLDNESREIQDWIDHYTVFKELTGQYSNDVDQAFYSKHEQALIDLSELKMENITVDNTLGIQEERTMASGDGDLETYKVDKENLSFEDLLNYDGVSELMKAQYEEYKKESEANNTKYSESLDKYLEEILSGGEIEYDTGIKKWVSLGIDVLPIIGDAKGVIQALAGIDIVTGRKLSDAERLLNLISLIPLYGDGTRLATTAVKGAYRDVAKIYAKEFFQNASAMGTNFVISKATEGSDLPPWVWILMYQGGRIGIKGVTENAGTIKARINGVKSGSFLDELRLKNPESYNNIMARVQNLTKDKRQLMHSMGTEELTKIYNSNKNLREVAAKLDKLGLTEDEKWNIRKILDSGESETIDKFAGIVVKYQGDKNKVLKFADEELRKIDESNEKLKNIKTDAGDLEVKANETAENKVIDDKKNVVKTIDEESKDISPEWQTYFDDIENNTGRKLTQEQKDLVIEEINNNSHDTKLTGQDYKDHRTDFNNEKDDLISQWEQNTNETWPTYENDVLSKKGNIYIKAGDKYDAHEIIPNVYDSPLEWWNLHPAARPGEHQGGIHGTGAAIKDIFK